jgi:hypothetical protein
MCLGVDIWRRTGSRAAFAAACGAAGFGLWVHQYIIYYWVAVALAVFHWLPQRQTMVKGLVAARAAPRWLRIGTAVVAFAAAVYAGLGGVAFLTGGFDLNVPGARVGVRHAQKLWNIAAGLFVIAAGARAYAIARRHEAFDARLLHAGIAGFVLGYAPALAAQVTGGGGAPIGRSDLGTTAASLFPIMRDVVPIVFGFKAPDTGWVGVHPLFAAPIALAAVASLSALRQRPFTPLFHFLLFSAAVLFLISGAYVDAQSYRYLMPAAGSMAVVLALGVWAIFQRSRMAGAATFVALITLFGWQQRAWYRQLAPDVQSRAILACLDDAGVRVAAADYWLSYKLTFLSGERIIVAPLNGVDRYPPYSELLRSTPDAPRIPDRMMGPSCTPDSFSSR